MIGARHAPAWQTYGRGLEGLVAGDTAIAAVTSDGRLVVRGYAIEELARHASFEEASYLVLHGELPDAATLETWRGELVRWREDVPAPALGVLRFLPTRSHPLAQYRTALTIAACHVPEGERTDPAAQWRRPPRILSWATTLAAAAIRHLHDRPPVAPRRELSHAANFLWQTLAREPSAAELRAFETSLIVQIEHGLHAAALAALTVFSTGTDLGGAVLAGMGALSGALHGGANQEAYAMLRALDGPAAARAWARQRLAAGHRFPGFGHRVYKVRDPRAVILEPHARALLESRGETRLWETYVALRDEVEAALGTKGVHANVDSITGLIYGAIGLPVASFPIPFCLAIQTGWMAHCLEYLPDGRVIEPGAVYVGPRG
ncbi:MAG: citrate/2-methylcitrate synthase [Candidatus Eiseniibacteriota bacterium]|jgi:citrate synthase